MSMKEIQDGYRRGHHFIELSMQNVYRANVDNYDKYKKELVNNIECHIDFLNKIKKELQNEKSSKC